MDLDDAVDLLYGIVPSGFTARRDALAVEARSSGDRALASAIKALRRPSAAAHAVNLLARDMGEQVAQLIDLGRRLQQAQESLSAEEIRALGRQRHQLIAGMAQEGASLSRAGGQPVSEAALREIEATLEAALGDERAAAAVRAGNLVRALSRTGLDPVDLTGAVAGTTTEGRKEPAVIRRAGTGAVEGEASRDEARREAERAEARSAAEWAHAVLRREQEHLALAEEALATATASREDADARVEALQQQLAAARRAADQAADDERRARRARADAGTDAESAEAAARRADERLAQVEGPA